MQPLWVAALLAVLGPHAADAALLRAGQPSALLHSVALVQNDTLAEIKAKWDNMDELLEMMFVIACKWKHGKDIDGAAAEKLLKGDLRPHDVEDFKKQVQAGNLKMLVQACGTIVASGEGKCRQSCARRWGEALQQRATCDQQCVTAYRNFETQCKQKADHLQSVYSIKLTTSAAQKRCRQGHCPAFPTVWMKDSAGMMQQEVDAQCQTWCTENGIKRGCERMWQLEVDVFRTSAVSACHAQGQVTSCFNGKKATESSKQTTCASSGTSTCETQYSTCTASGNVGSTFEQAKEFCVERRKMCDQQVAKQCLSDFNAGLEAARASCEQADAEALRTCTDKAVQDRKDTQLTECIGLRTPKCSEECHQKCDITKLNTCLANLKSESDPAEDFCKDFWHLLHESSEVDPVTGNPIVLLSGMAAHI